MPLVLLNYVLRIPKFLKVFYFYLSTKFNLRHDEYNCKMPLQLDQIHTYHPGYLDWFHDKKFAKSLEKAQPHLWQTVKLNTYWMLYSTFSLLQQKGIKLLFRCWDDECHIDFRRLHNHFKYTEIPDLPKLDQGRDWEHRGPKSHRRLAEGIWEVWNES